MTAFRVASFILCPLFRDSSRRSCAIQYGCMNYGKQFTTRSPVLLSDAGKLSSPVPVPQDLLMDKLKSAATGEQVLKLIGSHHSIMNQSHVLEALQTLHALQKREGSMKVKQEIIHSPQFLKLCHRLKIHSRGLALHESISAMKAMVLLGVPTTSPIMQILLQLIRHRVNELVPGQIVYIDSLLEKMQRSPLLEALKIALPLLFEVKLHETISDPEISPYYLADLLAYASKRHLSSECIQKLLQSLSRPQIMENIEVRAAQSIICSLCSKAVLPFSVKNRVISRCLEVISNSFHHCSKYELDSVTFGLSIACSKGYIHFYSEDFMDAYANYIIRCDVGTVQAVWALKKLARMSHVHIGLLEYIANNVEKSPGIVENGSAALLLCLVTGFSQGNYKPKNWDIIEEAILKNDHLSTGKLEIPWLKFAVELASLGCFHTPLLQRIFQEEFLRKFLSREYNVLDQLQLLLLNQAVKTFHPSYAGPYPPEDIIRSAVKLNGTNVESFVLQGALEKGLGGSAYVHQGFRTQLGHFIDHLIVMRKGGYPVALNVPKGCLIEELNVPSDSFLVAVIVMPASCYSYNCQRLKGLPALMIKTLESLNYSVLPVSYTLWTELPDSEKIPFLMQGINLKCSEHAALEETATNNV